MIYKFSRVHHLPYPYNQANIDYLNGIIEEFRVAHKKNGKKYAQRRAEERIRAEETLKALERNLSQTIGKASDQYQDIVGSGLNSNA